MWALRSTLANNGGKTGKKEKKIMMEIVATTSLPVDRLTTNNCNDATHANYLVI